MKRTIFHIDVNSAYLSWEAVYRLQKGDPLDLRTVPSIVGGDPKTRHGIVLAKSIPAKKFGIQTGETLYSALTKCPNLVIVPSNYSLYLQCSNAMMEIFREYSPVIQRYSVDEIFMDYTNMEEHYGDPLTAAHEIKDRIKSELGFTVNVGISNNKLLAKMASDLRKPDQVHTLYPHEIKDKMWPLPVEDLFMVGRATAPKLRQIGIETIGDLAQFDINLLKYKLKSHGLLIWQFANGIEESVVRVSNHIDMKGIGNSTTIPFDVTDKETAYRILLAITETVSMRLRAAACVTRVISVSIKNSEFHSYSHQRKLFNATDCTTTIFEIVKKLFKSMWKGETIRHLGVRVSDLSTNEFYQRTFFDDPLIEKKRAIDHTIDSLRMRYGAHAIQRAMFIDADTKHMIGGVGTDDYPMMSSLL